MKRRELKTYLIFTLLMFTSLFSACLDDTIESTQEGAPVSLTLFYNTGIFPEKSVTRALIDEDEENKVHNLYVFVFNAGGSISARQLFSYEQLTNRREGETATSGQVKINTTSGKKNVYAIANVDSKQPIANLTKAALDAITTERQLKEYIVSGKPDISYISRLDGKMLMSGSKAATLTAGMGNSLTVPLKRVSAKIEFTLVNGMGVEFEAREWKVINVPQKVRLLENIDSSDGGVTQAGDFVESRNGLFENYGTNFSFYLYENRKVPKKPIPGTGRAAYDLREKQVKTSVPAGEAGTVANGKYLYADDNASLVEIKGQYRKTETDGAITIADVTYRIHLGYINNNANDFNILRNTFYKYTVTINGVDDIIVEAKASSPDTEPASGAEGSVIRTRIKVSQFDSHYAIFSIRIPRSVVLAPPPKTRLYYVKTPFDMFGTTDINWVKFKNESVPGKLEVYPGESGDARLMNAPEMFDNIKRAHSENWSGYFVREGGQDYAYFTAYLNEYYYDRDPMTPDAPVDPTLWKRFVNKPDREMVLLGEWNMSPDGKSNYAENAVIIRQKSITTIYDPNSSATALGLESLDENFSQFRYNYSGSLTTGNNSPFDGWANTVFDSELASASLYGEGSARNPQHWKESALKLWDKYIVADKNISFPAAEEYKERYGWGTYYIHDLGARIGCMGRNRDINGNGKIDKNEVRWYMPAIQQLVNVWIGGGKLLTSQQMYKGPKYHEEMTRALADKTYGKRAIYLSSTMASSPEGISPLVFWSDEGSSISTVNDAVIWESPYGMDRSLFYTRCVRNLGAVDSSTQPQSFVYHDSGNRIISLVDGSLKSKIAPAAYRDTKFEPLSREYPEHDETDIANLPASKFRYARDYLRILTNDGRPTRFPSIVSWDYIVNGVKPPGDASPLNNCSTYSENVDKSDKGAWRLPNQRELMLLWRTNVLTNEGVWSSTLSKYDKTQAYVGRRDKVYRSPRSSTFKVRCVRDMK